MRRLEGNPGKRPYNENEPQISASQPSCPSHLTSPARREWQRIVPILARVGVLTEIDRAALAAYCQAYGRWVEAERLVKKEGMVKETANGYPIISPYLAIVNKALEQMHKYLVEFGLTPSSRSKVSAVPMVKEEDPLETLMREAEERAGITG